MGLIYKALSYISSRTSKYWKGEISMSKDAKLKHQVFTSIAKLPSDAKYLVVAELVMDVELMKILVHVE